MAQEDKELLIKDICARLPYGVVGQCEIDASYDTSFDTIPQTHKFNAVVDGINEDLLFVSPMIENQDELEFANEEIANGVDILDFKPYLFPLSSMTEKQLYELKEATDFKYNDNTLELVEWTETHRTLEFWLEEVPQYKVIEIFDWLNKNHFDYRCLIEKRLAIDATGKNIYMSLPDTYE